MDVEIVSTGGTFRALKEAGIAPLREVAEVTQFPEMLDGRVKTATRVLAVAAHSTVASCASASESRFPGS